MSAIDLMRQVRRRAKDNPKRALVQNNPLTAALGTITLRAADVAHFKNAGIECCFDDETDELVITSAAADSTAFTVAVDRGQDGTTATEHPQNTPLLIRPRFTNAELLERMAYIVDNELWPHVWLAGEAKVPYQAANEFYDPVVADIEEVVEVYQLSGGVRYPLRFDFLSRALGDDENFPNGAITLYEEADASDVYFAYRARPTLGNLSSALEGLLVMAMHADCVMAEESAHVGGDKTVAEGRVQDGSRLRAGAVLWDRFESGRTQHRIALQAAEQMRRRQVSGVRGAR